MSERDLLCKRNKKKNDLFVIRCERNEKKMRTKRLRTCRENPARTSPPKGPREKRRAKKLQRGLYLIPIETTKEVKIIDNP